MTVEQPDLSFLEGAELASAHQEAIGQRSEHGLWIANNSSLQDYSARARLPGGSAVLTEIIPNTIGFWGENTGLDVAAGSDMRALQDLLDMHVIGRGVGTNFSDSREWHLRNNRRLGHIAGDITRPAPWLEIDAWQKQYAPEGFAIAMHRPVGGLQELPQHTYLGAAHFILDRVREGGLLFTQIPRSTVRNPEANRALCDSIWQRGDIRDIMLSGPASPGGHSDYNDMFAVIFKR